MVGSVGQKWQVQAFVPLRMMIAKRLEMQRQKMKPQDNKDPRRKRSMRAIWDAFESLLLEKEYRKITVTELCARAEVNKKTFYTYYETLDMLLADYQEFLIEDYLETSKRFNYPEDIRESVAHFFLYASKQNKTYEKIMSIPSTQGIGMGVVDKVMYKHWYECDYAQQFTPEYREIISQTWVNTSLTIYRYWLADKKRIPLEDIIVTAQEMIAAGLEAFEKNAPPSAINHEVR